MSSYAAAQRAAKQGSQRKIRISEVDTSQGYISGIDRNGQLIRINFDFHNPVVAIPAPGDIWIAVQYQNQWNLLSKVESSAPTTPVSSLGPGDRRLEADGDLHLNGQNVLINGTNVNNLMPAGSVSFYAGEYAPVGWVLADGAAYDSTDPAYSRLFSVLGYRHNIGGEGPRMFRVPDATGRMLFGWGLHPDTSTLGANDGLPQASRTMKHYHSKGDLAIGASGAHTHVFTGTAAVISGGAHGHTFTGTSASTGAGTAHSHGAGTFAVAGNTGSGTAHNHGINDPTHTHSYGREVVSLNPGSTGYSIIGNAGTIDHTVVASGTNISIQNESAHTHSFSASTTGTSASESSHTHTFTAVGSISNTDTHTHNYTPDGTLDSPTHVHNNADFTGNVGTTSGVAETSAYLILNIIIKL